MKALKLLFFCSLILSISAIHAQNLSEGIIAESKGNYDKALQELRPLAAQGNVNAEVEIGAMYRYGQGVPVDYVQAFNWYSKAASKGNTQAQISVGTLYENGQGVLQDFTRAAMWFSKAAEKGSPPAEFQLGLMYARGQGVPKSWKEAEKLLNKARIQSYDPAEAYAGYMELSGKEQPKNYTRAMEWFRLAAYQENNFAIYHIALMYAEGLGVPRDRISAYAMSIISSKSSNFYPEVANEADELRKKLLHQLTPKQVQDAQALADGARHVGTVNAIDDRTYALTGSTFKGSGDPMFLPKVPPFLIWITQGGKLYLDHRLVDEPQLKMRLQMTHYQSPRPEVRIVIKGDKNDVAVRNMIATILADAKQLSVYNMVIARD
jgi:TPR repeat protein